MSAEPSNPTVWLGADGFRETLLAYFTPADAQALRRLGEILVQHARESRPNRDNELPDPFLSFDAVGRELRFFVKYLDEVADVLEDLEIPDLEPLFAAALAARARRRALLLAELAGEFERDVIAGTERSYRGGTGGNFIDG